MTTEDVLERTQFINKNGKALDPDGNEMRDENGCCIYVNEIDRHLFIIN